MKQSLIALATAGILASGVASADSLVLRFGADHGRSFYTIQDQQGHDFRRWHDEGRQMSVDERQARINARIEHGFQTGALTRRETRQLGRELATVEQKERAFESDGRLNRRERAELHRDLDNVAARLRFERRDNDRRN